MVDFKRDVNDSMDESHVCGPPLNPPPPFSALSHTGMHITLRQLLEVL